MSSQTLSFLERCWRKEQTGTTQLRVMSVDTAQEVPLSDSCLLLRIPVDEETLVERCLIRHRNSGRETSVQGGPELCTFVQTCLVLSKPDY
jgi:hypothetical protein